MVDEGKLDLLEDMYENWIFFRVTMDMIEVCWWWEGVIEVWCWWFRGDGAPPDPVEDLPTTCPPPTHTQMVFAKADPRVQQLYERSLVDPEYWEFGKLLREYVWFCIVTSCVVSHCTNMGSMKWCICTHSYHDTLLHACTTVVLLFLVVYKTMHNTSSPHTTPTANSKARKRRC